jgi:hypothetical protein
MAKSVCIARISKQSDGFYSLSNDIHPFSEENCSTDKKFVIICIIDCLEYCLVKKRGMTQHVN